MRQPPAIQQQLTQNQKLKQIQHLIMSQQMQQALQFLQLPIMELQSLIEMEMEHNPILEFSTDDPPQDYEYQEHEEQKLDFDARNFEIMQQVDEEFRDHFAETGSYAPKQSRLDNEKQKSFVDSLVCKEKSLFEYLMQQAHETFDSQESLKIAEALIGHVNEYGFIETELQEIATLYNYDKAKLLDVLKVVQTFDPPGVGASNIQEALLIQLRQKGKEKDLSYQILHKHYADLLHNRLPAISKKTGYSLKDISQAMRDIAKLDLHPGMNWSQTTIPYIIPDVFIKPQGDDFIIYVNEDPLPPLRLNAKYLEMLEDPSLSEETKDFIKKKIASAKWMLRNLTQRNETLAQIAHFLVKKQKAYFSNPEGQLIPMIMAEIAEELHVHESTIARTVSNKYMDTPRGLIALRSLFTNSYVTHNGDDISSQTVRDEILALIEKEDKNKPLSDQAISELLQKKGIPCARRTVAKYRQELHIGSTRQRKQYPSTAG